MAQSKPEKKPAPSSPIQILPMELKIGDRITDETGKWEVASRPYTTAVGKTASIRVKRINKSETEIRSWGAHERVAVRRA